MIQMLITCFSVFNLEGIFMIINYMVYLPEIRPEHEAEEGQANSLSSISSWPHHLENVFPIYAMGTSNQGLVAQMRHNYRREKEIREK